MAASTATTGRNPGQNPGQNPQASAPDAAAIATSLADVPDEDLWGDLEQTCGRIDRYPDDLTRRLALYMVLRDRGVFLKDIAAIAGVTPYAISLALSKAEQQIAGTWTPKPRTGKARGAGARKRRT